MLAEVHQPAPADTETSAVAQLWPARILQQRKAVDIQLRCTSWRYGTIAQIQRDVQRRRDQLIVKAQRDELPAIFDQFSNIERIEITSLIFQSAVDLLHPQLKLAAVSEERGVEAAAAAITHIAPDDRDRIRKRRDARIERIRIAAEIIIQPHLAQLQAADRILRKDDQLRAFLFRFLDAAHHLPHILFTSSLFDPHGHCRDLHHITLSLL